MQHKTKKIWLIALLSLLIAALFAASFTYARYYKETGVTGGKYDDTIEFVGANKYLVYTPEELVAAIENGYSYIEIADGAEDPFVITDGVTNVSANLVLDINGHSLVRNSRNPLINVQKDVSVVIVYDSKGSGSFYNPVGSLLQASGGTLTIATGEFTSGPKEGDYVTDVGTTGDVTVYYRNGDRGAEGYTQTSTIQMPAPSGNMYFADGTFTNGESNKFIKDDTFLIYTEETVETPEDATVNVDFSPLCDVASCDFYYYYEKSTEGSGEDKTTTYAVIYGYHDVMAGAKKQITAEGFNESEDAIIDPATAVIWPYAAVRMTEGEAFIRGGTYTNQFGTAQSYGIYARGGSLSVQGENTSFTSVADGVCIRCTTEDGSAPALHIENGSFTSYNGDTVQISGGTMNVKAGTFTKSGCKKDTENDQIDNQTAIISLQGGTLTVNGTKSGDENAPVYSVTMKAGGDANGGTLQNVFGVRAVGGGEITTEGVSFDIYGDYSAGVLSYDGTINLGGDTLINVTQSDAIKSGNTTVLTSAGVSSEQASSEASGTQQEEDHPVNLTGKVTIISNGLGITARGVVNVKADNDNDTTTATSVTVRTTRGTGIYVNNGEFNVEADASILVDSKVLSGYSWATPPKSGTTDVPNNEPNIYNGVYVQGGSLVSNGTLNVKFNGVENDARNETQYNTYLTQQIKSYAVRVEAASGSETQVTIASGDITNTVGGGVYVGGGTVTLGTSGDTTGYSEQNKTGLTVETTGKGYSTNGTGEFSGNWNYHWNLTGGDAIKVVNGTLHVNGGKYTSQQGNGILVSSGTANIYDGYFSGKDQYRYGSGFMTGPGTSYAFKLYGGTLNIFDGEFRSEGGGAFVMGTSADNKGTANIYGGIIEAKGATAVATWQYAEVLFNNVGTIAGAPDNYPDTRDLYVSGASTGITLEGNTDAEFSVTVQGSGTFTGGIYSNENAGINITENNMTEGSNRDGIWYGNSTAKLEISGGTFQGDNRSGLYFGKVPGTTDNSQNVQISGGTFTGDSAINADSDLRSDIYTNNIFEDSAYCYTDVLQDSNSQNERRSRAICDRKLNWFSYDYYQVGGRGSNSDIHLNDTTWVNSGSEARFYERDKIVVYSGLGQVTY